MTATQGLLERIAGLRERLAITGEQPAALAERLTHDSAELGRALRSLQPTAPALPELPRELTAQTRRLLQDAQELLTEQRRLAPLATNDVLSDYHKHTTTLLEAALRTVQGFPASAEAQVKACGGVQAMLTVAKDRCGILDRAARGHAVRERRIDDLARRLTDIAAARAVDPTWFAELADQLLDEARRGEPMRTLAASADVPARAVAAHAINVAQVLARLVPHDFEWSTRPLTPVAAALLMDVGRMGPAAESLKSAAPLTTEDRRTLECHPARGAAMLEVVFPDSALTCAAVLAHHERPDGTGYPNGSTADEIPNLAKLLRVADHYAALASERPHRPAVDRRTALTETLMAAEQGLLDREYAELLTHLSLHPIGSIVELTDGRIAAVIAVHPARTNVRAASRPVVAVLTDSFGLPYPKPEYLDLAVQECGGIERGLSRAECTRMLGACDPEYAV